MLQNYNKILTKRTVFSIILEKNPDQDLHTKKIRIFYAPRFFSGQNKKTCANYASKYGISSKQMLKHRRPDTVNYINVYLK